MLLEITKSKHYRSGKSLWRGDIVEYLGDTLPDIGVINVSKECPDENRLESYSISVNNCKKL